MFLWCYLMTGCYKLVNCVALSMQSDVVHQCVVRLPVETIFRECNDKVAINNFKRLVEELPAEDSAEAMEICGGMTSSLKRGFLPGLWGNRSSVSIWMTVTKHLHAMSC